MAGRRDGERLRPEGVRARRSSGCWPASVGATHTGGSSRPHKYGHTPAKAEEVEEVNSITTEGLTPPEGGGGDLDNNTQV
jgi:hypothetical protein